MKKILITSLALAAAVLAVSCQKEEIKEQKELVPMTINAVSESIGTATKTEMAYKYDILWSENDQIYVTDGTVNDTFTLTGGNGTTKGTFTQDGMVAFTNEVQAYYPATMVQGGSIVWPATQTNDQTVPMYSSKTVSGNVEDFNFSSLGSVLQIVFNSKQENIVLRSVEISDGEKTMSGVFSVDDQGKAEITASDKAGITLDLGESGVALGDGANYFNIAVPAGDYQKLKITFTAIDGKVCLFTGGRVNIAHNSVGRITLTGKIFRHINPLPEGALPGEFSISAMETIHFAKGNLQATYHSASATYSWGFAAHQFDYVGKKNVDLFAWSTTENVYGFKTMDKIQGDFVDWGKTIGDGNTWRTPSNDEWIYLIKNRPNAEALYRINVTICGKGRNLVLAPDGYAGTIESSYDEASWTVAESNGLVCLPAAGSFGGSIGLRGYYSSSTRKDDERIYDMTFDNASIDVNWYSTAKTGFSVRLVTRASTF